MSVSFVDNNGGVITSATPAFNLIDNYIYLYHTSTLVILPTFPESISDNVSTSYGPTNIMGRSAPIYSYSYSGPRTIDVNLKLHRDMMNEINIGNQNQSSITTGLSLFNNDTELLKKLQRKDYMDILIRELQSIAFPNYAASQKMVNPPLVAVRFGDEIFCKGIVDGGVSVNYSGPILANPLYDSKGDYIYEEYVRDGHKYRERAVGKGKYALADISFRVSEVDPYSADLVAQQGSFRGINRTLERNLYKVSV